MAMTARLEKTPSVWKRCAEFTNTERFKDNLRLITLPFPGTRKFDVTSDNFSPADWRRALREFGVASAPAGMDCLYEDE